MTRFHRPSRPQSPPQSPPLHRLGDDTAAPHADPNAAQANPHCDVYLPLHYEPGYAYPLIVWLADHNSPSNRLANVMAQLSLRNYVAVAPTLNQTADAPPADAIATAIRKATTRANLRNDRVFIVARDQWCVPAYRALAQLHPQQIAGLAWILDAPNHHFAPPATSTIKPESRSLKTILACMSETDQLDADDVIQQSKVWNASGLRLRVKTSTCGPKFLGSALRNVDRWIMEHITGEKCLDAHTPNHAPLCLN